MDDAGKLSNKNNASNMEDESDLKRGPWTVDEDFKLINYIATHGEGRWNSLARSAGLNRTGKSCRLRWLNYLRPDVRRGNISLEEQLLILELHSQWGNRWSKIAQYLPGRTDNEIKNYWRTRVQKHAKQLKCDVNSKQFKDTMRYLWMPRLIERIQAASTATPTTSSTNTCMTSSYDIDMGGGIDHHHNNILYGTNDIPINNQFGSGLGISMGNPNNTSTTPDNSSSMAVSPISDLTEYYCNVPASINNQNGVPDSFPAGVGQTESNCWGNIPNYYGPTGENSFNLYDGLYDIQGMEQGNNVWFDGGDSSESLWNVDDQDFWYSQPHNTGSLF